MSGRLYVAMVIAPLMLGCAGKLDVTTHTPVNVLVCPRVAVDLECGEVMPPPDTLKDLQVDFQRLSGIAECWREAARLWLNAHADCLVSEKNLK